MFSIVDILAQAIVDSLFVAFSAFVVDMQADIQINTNTNINVSITVDASAAVSICVKANAWTKYCD